MWIKLSKLKRGEQFRLTNKPDAPVWTKYVHYDSRYTMIGKGEMFGGGIAKAVSRTKLVYV